MNLQKILNEILSGKESENRGILKVSPKAKHPIHNFSSFNLPAGTACPFAKRCKAWVEPVDPNAPPVYNDDGSVKKFKVVKGKDNEFTCYAAESEARYPSVYAQRKYNYDKLKGMKSVDEMADFIYSSLIHHNVQKHKTFRIHDSGDFFNQMYFDAWIEVAKRLPDTVFYGYTTSIPYLVKRKNDMPDNFRIVASKHPENEHDVEKHGLHYSQVVHTVEEGEKKNLPFLSETAAYDGKKRNFAILSGKEERKLKLHQHPDLKKLNVESKFSQYLIESEDDSIYHDGVCHQQNYDISSIKI